jgi:group II intron reverse transcriptase/maturase
MPTSLRGIADRARKDKKARFRDLYRMLNVENLRECFYLLRRQAAPGVDGVSVADYEEKLEANLHDLVQRLKKKRYRAKLLRRKHIPKGEGKTRPLGIPALEDKIVQMAVSRILQSIYEADFLNVSWGYRPNRGPQLASKVLAGRLAVGRYNYIVEADIAGFFNNIDHDWMLKMLALRIDDAALLGLIRKWLKAGILEEDGNVKHPVTGTPQGGIVSPVLANVYLHYALDLWFERVVRRHVRGQATLIRYADDFVCAFEHEADAAAFLRVLPKRLAKFGLETAPEKTGQHRFSRHQPAQNGTFSFLGFQYRWRTTRTGKSKVQRETDPRKLQKSTAAFKEWIKTTRHRRLDRLLPQLRRKMSGYWNYFGISGNFARLRQFWWQSLGLLYKWLNRRSHKPGFTWKKLVATLSRYNIPGPHIPGRSVTASSAPSGVPCPSTTETSTLRLHA